MPISTLLDALVPVLGLLMIGFLSRRRHLMQDGFWTYAEKLSYYLLMPALIVKELAGLDAGTLPVGRIALAIVLTLATAVVVLTLLRGRLPLDGASFTSVVQGGVRFNTYVGLSLVAPLYGPQGLAIAALSIGVMIATINVICVTAFALCVGDGRPRPALVAKQLLQNPLLMACALGGLLQVTGVGLPPGLGRLAATLGGAALPLGVMAVGAALARVEARMPAVVPFVAASVVKFLIIPVSAAVFCALLGLGPAVTAVVVLLNAMPTAPSGYVLARQMGGDHVLMAALITGQTVLACGLLPVLLLSGLFSPG